MTDSRRRQDISTPYGPCWTLIGRVEEAKGRVEDYRRFFNAVFWILRTGVPWQDKGIWEEWLNRMMAIVIRTPLLRRGVSSGLLMWGRFPDGIFDKPSRE